MALRKHTKRNYKKSKFRVRTLRNRKVQQGGDPVLPEDIMYSDRYVTILKPEVKKGILVCSRFNQPNNTESLCTAGLKTGAQLQKEGVNFGRSVYHPYIFFRAPYYSNPIDYTSIESEIYSSYGDMNLNDNIVFIRVDPDTTLVLSSKIRVKYTNSGSVTGSKEGNLSASEITLSRYLERIDDISKLEKEVWAGKFGRGKTPVYDVVTREANVGVYSQNVSYPYNTVPINRNSEILVSIPHLTPDYFVLCTTKKN